MTVTAIMELSATRSKIYIDDEFAFVLYKGELRLYDIKQGEDIQERNYNTIIDEVLPKRAKLRAMNLLTKKDYTVSKLRKKLEEGLYPKHIIDEALEYVEAYHYVDDLRFAEGYITYHEGDRSKKRLEIDLLNKGIDKAVIEKAFLIWEEKGGEDHEEDMILKFLMKKKYNKETMEYKEQQKIIATLVRKGFEFGKVMRVIENNIDDIMN